MAQQRSAGRRETESLLSEAQTANCQTVASKETGLISQRASALLALSEGMTQAKAAETSGLTVGQVRYLLTVFRRKGMAIFEVKSAEPLSAPAAKITPVRDVAIKPATEKAEVKPVKKAKKKTAPKKDKVKKKAGSKGPEKKAKDKKNKEKNKKKTKGKKGK